MRIIIFVVSFSAVFIFFLAATPSFAAFGDPLIPCGNEGQEACQACHVVQLGQNILEWCIGVMASVIALVFAWGGMKMVMSGGNPGEVSQGREMMTNAVIGFVILLSAWLVIDTILKLVTNEGQIGVWNEIQCVAQPERVQSTTSTPGGTTAAAPAGTYTDATSRELLGAAGISVNKTEAQGTSLTGMRPATVQDIIDLKRACPDCNIVVTGGTEDTGGHTTGTASHVNGYKYDLRLDDTLNTYITTTFTSSGVRSDGAQMYTAPDGSVYAREGDHWDVVVPGS